MSTQMTLGDTSLLSFHKTMLSDLYGLSETDEINTSGPGQDALLISSHGLGLSLLLSSLISLHSHPKNLILLLNCPDSLSSLPPLKSITSLTPSSLRKNLYLQGGVLSITNRILVVDILTSVIPIHLISGIIVCQAHKVSESSLESFILRVFRDGNKVGFIKALSEVPEVIAGSLTASKLDSLMKHCFIRNVYLYPRFHINVQETLEKYGKVNLVELRIPLSKRMKIIQSSVLECLKECLMEVKRLNPVLETESLTLENALFSSFDLIIKSQLDPIWHRVSYKTKQLLLDIKVLRKVLGYLVSYDSITFYSFLETIRASSLESISSSSSSSVVSWFMIDAADTLFRVAKERVYSTSKSSGKLEYNLTLEQQPKWHALIHILHEIYQRKKTGEKVLVMTRENRTARQLSEVLRGARKSTDGNQARKKEKFISKGAKDLLHRLLQKFASWRGGLHSLMEKILSEKYQDGVQASMSLVDQQAQATLTQSENASTSNVTRNGAPASKRRRVRGGSSAASSTFGHSTSDSQSGLSTLSQKLGKSLGKNFNFDEEALAELAAMLDAESSQIGQEDVDVDDSPSTPPDSTDPLPPAPDFSESDWPELHIHSYHTNHDSLAVPSSSSTGPTGDDDSFLLQKLNPTYIIMYDPDMAFVRRVEVFQALRVRDALSPNSSGTVQSTKNTTEEETPETGGGNIPQLHIYFMVYDQSIEEQQYLTSLRREKDAFERLIQQKRTMVVPMDQDGRRKDDVEDVLLMDTRRAGGQSLVLKRQVIIDVREFRSSLPLLLYKRTLSLVPCTLEVGDYILSPRLCIERKAIPDLVSSLKSGRLYTQCEGMCLYYDVPIVLIEFGGGSAFTLQSYFLKKQGVGSGGGGEGTVDLMARLVLLCLHFPKVGFLWSSSPAQTALMFDDLKKNEKEPDPETAQSIGTNPVSSSGTQSTRIDSVYSITPYEILRSLPGITVHNIPLVLSNAKNIRELSEWNRNKCVQVLGEMNGKKLFEFLHQKGQGQATGGSSGGAHSARQSASRSSTRR